MESFLKAKAPESGMQAIKVSCCFGLTTGHGAKVVNVAQYIESLPAKLSDDEAGDTLAASWHPVEDTWQADVHKEPSLDFEENKLPVPGIER